MSELTGKDLHWFRTANASPWPGFYEFKDRFLKRFAAPVGFDLQKIELECHACDGTGTYCHVRGERCHRCSGTGIYDVREHWLQRWDLGGHIYHKPMPHHEVYHLNDAWKYPDPVNVIEGRITHGEITQQESRRAFYRLLIRHEPMTYYRMIVENIHSRVRCGKLRLHWKLIRLRNKLDLFKSIPEDDEVPF